MPDPIVSTGARDAITILHVDDSAADRYRRRRALQGAGFEVREAASGAACDAALAERWPDIVLLDVKLPDTHGFDLTRRIKARAEDTHRSIAVVLISTCFLDSASRVEGLDSGADAYLIEPVSDAELVASMRVVTRGLHAVRQAVANERALQAHAQALRESDRVKTEFLAMVSHELRQPLQAALAALGVMKMRHSRVSGEKARDTLERQLQQMRVIVEDLLDATRVVRGQAGVNRQPEDLRAVVQGAIETAGPSIYKRDHVVAFSAPEMPVIVHGDAGRLQQVVVNLLSNAARYTPNGGAIAVQIEQIEHKAFVRVKDTGAGISPDHLPHLFTLFTRGTTEGTGLGIGLAVAKSLVELHGGTIQARSAGVGQGAEFVVSLPVGTHGSAPG